MEENKSFITKDIFSMSISIIAIVLSLTSFYFSNLRIEDNLQARIINTNISHNDGLMIKDTAVIQVAFMNAGNRQSILLKPWYQLADRIDEYNGSAGGPFENNPEFPLILQPHEMKIVDLKLSLENINLNLGKVVDTIDKKKIYQSFCKIQFYALDSKANNHDVFTNFQVQIITNDQSIRSILSANNKDYNSYKSTLITK